MLCTRYMLGYLVSVLHCVVLMLLDVLWRVHVILRCQPKKSKTIVLPQCWCCSDVIICSQPLEYGVTCRVLVLWWYLRRIPVLSSSYLFLPLGCSYQVCCIVVAGCILPILMISRFFPDIPLILRWCYGDVLVRCGGRLKAWRWQHFLTRLLIGHTDNTQQPFR